MRYRLFLLDPTGDVRARFGLESDNDQAAAEQALAFANGEPLEVWRDTEKVFSDPGRPPEMSQTNA